MLWFWFFDSHLKTALYIHFCCYTDNTVVEMECVIDVHYASLTSQGEQHREIIWMVTHPDINPIQQCFYFGEQTGTGLSL